MNSINYSGPQDQEDLSAEQISLSQFRLPVEMKLCGARIDSDRKRYKDIAKGKVRRDLRKFISEGQIYGKKGKDIVSIPIPEIDIPHFRHDSGEGGGVGEGDGEPGDAIGQGEQPGQGDEAGEEEGQHALTEEVSIEELAQMLGDELELPNIEPKGKKNIESTIEKYNTISVLGPDSLRHKRRTLMQTIRREIASGTYDPDDPDLVPVREDFRYRAPKIVPKPDTNAVIIYEMDVSGSMGEEKRDIARTMAFWLNAWLDSQYGGCEKVFIVHDVKAKEVDEDTFFRTQESGGTKISSAYEKALQVIKERYNPEEWNIYIFHFSDGDNWQDDDNKAIDILGEELLSNINLFGFGKIGQGWSRDDFSTVLDTNFTEEDGVVVTKVDDREFIPEGLRELLSTGN